MSKKTTMKPIAAAIGTAFVLGVAAAPASAADANPFGMADLNNGYKVAAEEGKCGGKKAEEMKAKAAEEGKCGGKKAEEMKAMEGKCGGNK